MKKTTHYFLSLHGRACWLACLLWLMSLSYFGHAQTANRAIPPTTPPSDLLCSPPYGQKSAATYVAANHLSGSFSASDIGVSGVTTTIDAGLYGGTVIFSGIYRVRGHVKLVNGTFELRPGTAFHVEGVSGQFFPNTTNPAPTTIDVENGHLELVGAVILSTCPRAWGGINLLAYGRITTRPNPAATAPAGRSSIRDAYVGVRVTGQPSQRSTGEYYLTGTDFVNNYVGVEDAYKTVARAGEGVHYCTFSTDANYKAPLSSSNGYPPIGVYMSSSDQQLGYNNYAAASIDHSSFRNLNIGINGVGQQLHINDNTFDYCWRAAIDLDFTLNGQGAFSFTPMYVERNNITVRGANPAGNLTSWGILGGVYARDNYIHGDAANPASNGVEQVGMYMISPDNSTQTRNTFERLDTGIEAGVDNWFDNQERDISGNMFRDVGKGITFFTPYYYDLPIQSYQLHIRCNSFENPGSLAGTVALNVVGPGFPRQMGAVANGNGNRFVTPGLPFIEPIANTTGNTFTYYALGSSSQELFPALPSSTYLVTPTGGNPATVCTGAGYSNGIYSRSNSKLHPDPFQVQSAYDSLRLSAISANRRNVLISVITTFVSKQQDFARLETYLTSQPQVVSYVHATLSGWLLRYYRTEHREPDAQRVRAALLSRHPADPEVSNFVQLSDALIRLSRSVDPLALPAPADVTSLQQVAASGTASARVACPVARRYSPACPCRFFDANAAKALAKKRDSDATKVLQMGAAYPNPVGEWVLIPYTLPAGHRSVYLEVRNALGQLVRRVALSSGSGEVRIGVGTLAAGLYQVALVGAGQPLVTQRLSVNH